MLETARCHPFWEAIAVTAAAHPSLVLAQAPREALPQLAVAAPQEARRRAAAGLVGSTREELSGPRAGRIPVEWRLPVEELAPRVAAGVAD